MSRREHHYHLAGWILFLVCAIFFIASAATSGDRLYLVGSVLFFIACIVFVIPLVSTDHNLPPPRSDQETGTAQKTNPFTVYDSSITATPATIRQVAMMRRSTRLRPPLQKRKPGANRLSTSAHRRTNNGRVPTSVDTSDTGPC